MKSSLAKLSHKYGYLAIIITFLALSIIWLQLSTFTWDDDAVTRYMNVLNARHNFRQFLSGWNRPLFVVIFYIPIQLFGRAGAGIAMILLTALSAWLLYKGLQKKGIAHPCMAVFFLLFQTFLFGIARDAMTEPLASFIICLGIYLYYKEDFFWFAVVAGLLPLARTEAILLMPFWLLPLLQHRKYAFIPLMGAGMLAWALAFFIYTGHPFALLDELLVSGKQANKYGHMALTHHIGKYVYVLGPVAFFFFIQGYLVSTKRLLADYFILLQFTVGFIIYVIFAAYLNIGQSGGALRNLITLAPFAAVISLYGFNYWWNLFAPPVPATGREGKLKPGKAKQPAVQRQQKEAAGKILDLVLLCFLISVIGYIAFTNKLVLRQYYDPIQKDYTILRQLLACSLCVLLPGIAFFRANIRWVAIVLLLLQLSFTLSYENPQSHGNEERRGMDAMTTFIRNSELRQAKIYCNHPWYYWSAGINPYDSIHAGEISRRNMPGIPEGSLVLWDSHYNGENYTNTAAALFLNDTTFSPVMVAEDDQHQAFGILFLKLSKNQADNDRFFSNLAKTYSHNDRVLYFKGVYERNRKANPVAALADFNAAMALNPNRADIYLARGICYLLLNNKEKACPDLKQAAVMGEAQAPQLLATYCK